LCRWPLPQLAGALPTCPLALAAAETKTFEQRLSAL
jgi:hypothetical protein